MSHWLYSFTGSNPVVLIVTFDTLWAFGEIGITPPAIGRRKRDRNLQGPASDTLLSAIPNGSGLDSGSSALKCQRVRLPSLIRRLPKQRGVSK